MAKVNVCLFGVALYNVRKRMGLSQAQLAANIDMSDEYLSVLTHSRREPRARTILQIGRGLSCPVGELMNEMDRLTREYEETGILPQLPDSSDKE